MKLRFIFVLFFFAPVLVAEEIPLPTLKQLLVIDKVGPKKSDNLVLKVRLKNITGSIIVEFPELVGPIYVSEENKQLFSCESNAVHGVKSASTYDLHGKLVYEFSHIGFVRNCGMTDDGRIYWLHYNDVINKKPMNVFVAISSIGSILHKETFEGAKVVTFSYDSSHYRVNVNKADWPG